MAIKQYVSLNEPLCGIETYKDTLNLANGDTTRQIKKLVLTGEENVAYNTKNDNRGRFGATVPISITGTSVPDNVISSHLPTLNSTDLILLQTGICMRSTANDVVIAMSYSEVGITSPSDAPTIVDAVKTYLAQQYANGTPVCVWYVLETPETSTTTLPHGLSGMVEGSLTQTGTPTPTNPVYPTANSIDAFLDKKYRKYGTETDTLTSLPADVIADGQSATANIIGNMVQTGTPTPSSIIMPSECGNKTANLWDGDYQSAYLTATGYYITPDTTTKSSIVKCEPNTTYTIKQIGYYEVAKHKWRIAVFDSKPSNNAQGTLLVNDDSLSESTITTLSDSAYIVVYYMYPISSANANFMINLGSTALPYQPYGYKIPISSGGTTTNVYLGEVQSERQIYEVILTGQETGWQGAEASGRRNRFVLNLSGAINADTTNPYSLCSHLPLGESGATYSTDNVYTIASGKLYMRLTTDYDTLITFKTYLAQQYTNGTPVTVWYVLATPTTTTLNEPIRKIGTYADSVSATNIPTTGTAESFDIDTELKPSEVQLTYHGWHEHSDTKFTT